MFKLKLIGGDEFLLTAEEAKSVMSASGSFVAVSRLELFLNKSSISIICNEKNLTIDRSKQMTGVLHDGTKVIKQFGLWKDADNPEVRLDPKYYPEVYRDEVMNDDEYRNWKDTGEIPDFGRKKLEKTSEFAKLLK